MKCLNGDVLGGESGCPQPECLGFYPACHATVELACLVSHLIYVLGVFNMFLPQPSKTQYHKITQGRKLPGFLTKHLLKIVQCPKPVLGHIWSFPFM